MFEEGRENRVKWTVKTGYYIQLIRPNSWHKTKQGKTEGTLDRYIHEHCAGLSNEGTFTFYLFVLPLSGETFWWEGIINISLWETAEQLNMPFIAEIRNEQQKQQQKQTQMVGVGGRGERGRGGGRRRDSFEFLKCWELVAFRTREREREREREGGG